MDEPMGSLSSANESPQVQPKGLSEVLLCLSVKADTQHRFEGHTQTAGQAQLYPVQRRLHGRHQRPPRSNSQPAVP